MKTTSLTLPFSMVFTVVHVGNGLLLPSTRYHATTNLRSATGISRCSLSSSVSKSSSSTLSSPSARTSTTITTQLHLAPKSMEPDEIKRQLTEYLTKRRQENADEKAKAEKGKTIGGTKGNKVLNYISGAPVKEYKVDRIPNIFDYDELTKYGYSNLVTPIMNLGGRRAVYDLMDMEPPPLPGPPPKIKVPKLEIDRTGQSDQARYTGLKMGQILDDGLMGEVLAKTQEKAKKGETLRPKLMEEEYELPFADKRNVGPKQTPDWTPELLDEYTAQQGKAISWAKKARMGEFIKDPDEDLTQMPIIFRLYCALTAFEIAFAYGRSTPTFLLQCWNLQSDQTQGFMSVFQSLGLALCVGAIGGGVVCGALLAPEKNRSSFVWGAKGLIAGPLAVRQLRELDALITRGEKEEAMKQ